MRRKKWWAALGPSGFLFLAAAVGVSCGGGGPSTGFDTSDGGDEPRMYDSGGGSDTGGIQLGMDSSDETGTPPPDSAPPPAVAVVYAESPDTLYKLDPTTNAISVVAPFSGDCASQGDCTDIIDIALDEMSNGYATTYGAFYKFDVKTAITTLVSSGSYPNSLSFVPKGTLDPSQEALVGYDGATYIRIDTTSGAITKVGKLTGGYTSSGDIVSVIGGGTFLTVKSGSCGDCLLQIDPTTGDLIQNYGSVNHPSVFGIAFWAGSVYGFDDGGDVFSITFAMGKLVTTDIPVPGAPAGLEFYGAGSTTSAPPKSADGGGIPIK
jgi:hypothetical protein